MSGRWHTFLARLGDLFRRRRIETDLNDELGGHFEKLVQVQLDAGMSLEAARLEAHRRFGPMTQIKERARDEYGFVPLEQWGKDARFAVRSLARAPGFTLTIWLTLVAGIGVAAFVFRLTAGILFFAQPYPRPEQLVMIGFKDKQVPFTPYRNGVHFLAYQEQTFEARHIVAAG
jgi:hypothetical protein